MVTVVLFTVTPNMTVLPNVELVKLNTIIQ